MNRITVIIIGLTLVCSAVDAMGQSSHQTWILPSALQATPQWDSSLTGKWTYRSYRNRADIIVGSDPDPAVQALVPIFGQGIIATASATKALNLIFGEGVMTFNPPIGNSLTGTFDMGGGYVLDLKGTMQTTPSGDIAIEVFGTGRVGTPTKDWEYDYRALTTPKWPNGINQVPSLVGTVIRAKPHDGGAAGVVASFIAVKQ
jgi:hypothetical protein